MAEFRTASIEPTIEELNNNRPPVLNPLKSSGSYPSLLSYLKCQFLLLREDLIRPLREDINNIRHFNDRDVIIYNNVHWKFSTLHFPDLKTSNLPDIMKFDNIVCISNDNFENFVIARISDKNDEVFKKKKSVEINLLTKNRISGDKRKCQVIESKSFFVAYKHVLETLQEIKRDGFPFLDYIVYSEVEIALPKYLEKKYSRNVLYDMSSIPRKNDNSNETLLDAFSRLNIANVSEVPIMARLSQWPSAKVFGMDQSQLEALHFALKSSLCIIQGPPGTGKTSIAMNIIKVMLANATVAGIRLPIIIITFKNKALDELLERVLEFDDKIVRLGGGSESEKIKYYNVNKIIDRKKSLDNSHMRMSEKRALVCRKANVLGMTTTGAAMHRGLIDRLKPAVGKKKKILLYPLLLNTLN